MILRLRRLVPALLSALCLAFVACAPVPPTAAPTPPLETLAQLPAELVAALDDFRAEGPRGWAFTQTTSGADKVRVERYNPRLRGSARWTLLLEDGVAPTEAELEKYRATRPSIDSASGLASQLDRTSVAVVARDGAVTTYEFRLKPVSEKDAAAPHMRARFSYDSASRAFTRVELFNVQAFKPAFSLTILEARTTLAYVPPDEGLPALPHEVVMHVSGRRFFFSDFEQTVTSRFTDHEYVAAPAPEAATP